jgi:hypothetical protein
MASNDIPPAAVGGGRMCIPKLGRINSERFVKVRYTLKNGMFLSKRRFGVWNNYGISARILS